MTLTCTFPNELGWIHCTTCGQKIYRRSADVTIHPVPCQAIKLDAPRDATCQHLGQQVGEQPCTTCRGNTRLKVFACHAGYGKVTMSQCGPQCSDYAPHESPNAAQQTLLLRFGHGLGDHVQCSVVLQHIRELFPAWTVDVACKAERVTGFVEAGLCRAVYQLGTEPEGYDEVRTIHWREPEQAYDDSPATKAERCLRDIFQITPRAQWCGYRLSVPEETAQRVASHVAPLGRFVVLHYQGNTAPQRKNPPEFSIRKVVRKIVELGRQVVLIDFDEKSGLREEKGVTVFPRGHAVWPYATGDAATLAALASKADLAIGVDSGPGKAFATTRTPTLILWPGLHPIHYHGIDQCVHVLRQGHERAIQQPRDAGASFFYANYGHVVLRRNFDAELPALVEEALTDWQGLSARARCLTDGWWRAGDLPIVREQSADEYHLDELPVDPAVVLDIGAHVGLFARRSAAMWPGTQIVCLEPAAENLPYLERNTLGLPAAAEIIHGAVVPHSGDWQLLNSCSGNAGSSDSVVVEGSIASIVARMSRFPGRWQVDESMRRFLTWDDLPLDGALVKIDVEGGEWELLPALAAHRKRIVGIVGEYHGGHKGRGAQERLKALAAEHFPGWSLRLLSDKLAQGYDDGSFWLLPCS